MKKIIITAVSVAAFAVALAQTAQAVPITGNVGFSGAVQLNTDNVQTATEALTWVNPVVNGASGSFSGIAQGTPVTLAIPWFFNSGALNNFWMVGGFTFNLLSSHVYSQDGLFLDVVMSGTVSGNSFDPTAFTGTFQAANPPANGNAIFTGRMSFSSVPDGGSTVLLLGLACIGMSLIKRKLGTVTPVS
ncbi:MAG: hypothetical protein P4N60_09640 [Verrucomicrobiae bacterium]|nr:hypothetical protein [Verrucomicrobiae bacterium]